MSHTRFRMVLGSNLFAVTWTSDNVPVSSKNILDIQATTECKFTLKRVCDFIRTHRSIWPLFLTVK